MSANSPQDTPLYMPASTSESFQAAMEKLVQNILNVIWNMQ